MFFVIQFMSVPEKETPLNNKKSRKGTDKEKLQSYTLGRNPVPVEVGSLAVYPIIYQGVIYIYISQGFLPSTVPSNLVD